MAGKHGSGPLQDAHGWLATRQCNLTGKCATQLFHVQAIEQHASKGNQQAAEAFWIPRPSAGRGRFAASGDQRVSADRLEFRRLNLARLRMCVRKCCDCLSSTEKQRIAAAQASAFTLFRDVHPAAIWHTCWCYTAVRLRCEGTALLNPAGGSWRATAGHARRACRTWRQEAGSSMPASSGRRRICCISAWSFRQRCENTWGATAFAVHTCRQFYVH